MSFSTLIALIKEMTGWKAMVDIALITAGLFFLYHTLLRLGTWRIVAGIMLAAFLFLIANFLDLKGLEWIFGNFSQVAAIALIVIFQPELRKIFERAVSVRRFEIRDAGAELSQMVADSLIKLAGQRCGAIVVFPGKEPIEEWLSGGFKLDARPSIPLIMSIFDPNSQGHDGALIIQKGRFTRFGVRLPVSLTSKLPDEFGTRHHAAMGLAEKSDALVFVVSEERGKISIFDKGKFRQVDDPEKLAGTIISHWKHTSSYPVKIPQGKKTMVDGFTNACQSVPGSFFLVDTHHCSKRNAGKNRDCTGGIYGLAGQSHFGRRQAERSPPSFGRSEIRS